MDKNKEFEFSKKGISEALVFLHDEISSSYSKIDTNRYILIAEEYMLKFLEKHDDKDNNNFSVKITGKKSVSKIVIMSNGDVIDKPIDENSNITDVIEKNIDTIASNFIQNVLINKFGKIAKYKHINGKNTVTINIGSSGISQLRNIVAAIILAGCFGFVLNAVGIQPLNDFIVNQVLDTARNIFMNCLMIVIGPMIFFSIVMSVSQYTDITVLGKIGVKTMVFFMFAAICSVIFTILLFNLIGSHMFTSQKIVTELYVSDAESITSLKSFINNIVPNNFAKPFVENSMLQIMFLAIIIGIATATIGDRNKSLINMFESLYNIFSKIMIKLVSFIPALVFCSISIMIIETGINELSMYGKLILMLFIVYFVIFIYYAFIIRFFANIKPFNFIRKYGETALTILSVSSSNACIPITMKFCDEKLGISKKIYSFIVPLGATINMTGTVAVQTLLSLFIIRTYNINIDIPTYFVLFISIIISTMACPGLVGGSMIIFASLSKQFGFPNDALSIVLPFIMLVDMPITLVNVTGDIVTSLIVAKQEKMLNNNIYNS